VASNSAVARYYRQQAVECETLAAATQNLRTRDLMLDFARCWTAFADECEGKEPFVPPDGWVPPSSA
jgi:hypothetical protein